MMRSVFLRAAIKRSWLSLCVPVVACLAQPSVGAPVNFSPAGTGAGFVQVANFDEKPGNALAVGAQTAIANALASIPANAVAGTQATSATFTLYYQANITLVGADGNTISTPGFTFTAVAKFDETATVTKGSNTVTFNLAATQPGSYLDFFATKGTIGDNATGTNFATDNPNATLIYSASPVGPERGNFTNFGGSTNLDSFPGTVENNPQQSVFGNGQTTLSFATTFFNPLYFQSNPGTTTFVTGTALPFTQADPSAKFVNVTGPNVGSFTYIQPNLGSVNGASGPDVQFEADASNTFAVPEPASFAMTLLGLGGMGLGTVVSRRRAKARATAA